MNSMIIRLVHEPAAGQLWPDINCMFVKDLGCKRDGNACLHHTYPTGLCSCISHMAQW
jgi:hypothetical protein